MPSVLLYPRVRYDTIILFNCCSFISQENTELTVFIGIQAAGRSGYYKQNFY